MNIVTWVLQILLGLAFLTSGLIKVSQPRAKLMPRMAYVEDLSDGSVKTIGAFEMLGGIGVILPDWTGIAPILTPLAACGLAIIMIGAAITHLRRHEPQAIAVNAVLFIIAVLVAILRFGPYSY
jgi:uncharacterized membrane protein YphA (DoxX/SURF4 family)